VLQRLGVDVDEAVRVVGVRQSAPGDPLRRPLRRDRVQQVVRERLLGAAVTDRDRAGRGITLRTSREYRTSTP
jgi:hypothetical protein